MASGSQTPNLPWVRRGYGNIVYGLGFRALGRECGNMLYGR